MYFVDLSSLPLYFVVLGSCVAFGINWIIITGYCCGKPVMIVVFPCCCARFCLSPGYQRVIRLLSVIIPLITWANIKTFAHIPSWFRHFYLQPSTEAREAFSCSHCSLQPDIDNLTNFRTKFRRPNIQTSSHCIACIGTVIMQSVKTVLTNLTVLCVNASRGL